MLAAALTVLRSGVTVDPSELLAAAVWPRDNALLCDRSSVARLMAGSSVVGGGAR
jgi:hypothetical protein